ncbi:MAG: DUF4115 domain-containing protein, partial [Pacificimonas sp.]
LLIGLVILGAIGWGAGWFGGENDVADVDDDPLAEQDIAANVGMEEPELVDEPMTPAAPVLPTGQIVIAATADAWMRVSDQDGGNKLFERVLAAGESFTLPEGESGMYIKAGNAGALTISIGDTEMPKLGRMGSVVGPVALTAEALSANAGGDAATDGDADPGGG